jgi:hypothetical protein
MVHTTPHPTPPSNYQTLAVRPTRHPVAFSGKPASSQFPTPAFQASFHSYELFLRDLIGNQLGRGHKDSYVISFHVLSGREICRIHVKPASKPVYFNGDFYPRESNKKSKLRAKEATEYIKIRWG